MKIVREGNRNRILFDVNRIVLQAKAIEMASTMSLKEISDERIFKGWDVWRTFAGATYGKGAG